MRSALALRAQQRARNILNNWEKQKILSIAWGLLTNCSPISWAWVQINRKRNQLLWKTMVEEKQVENEMYKKEENEKKWKRGNKI